MGNRKIILHVGFDKVGSSSIQTYLSNNELITKEKKYVYGTISKNGAIATKNLQLRAQENPLGYVNSYSKLAVDANIDNLKINLDKLYNDNNNDIIPIFSCEGWARQARNFRKSKIFERLDVEAIIVFYVRPQVDWLNSAWWQWFNWHPEFSSPQDYFKKIGHRAASWEDRIKEWENVPNVQTLQVRLQNKDNVSDFLSLFDISISDQGLKKSRSNISLSPELLMLLNQYPEFRGVHDSKVDWRLAEVFNYKGKTPWVIKKDLISEAISFFSESNRDLLLRLNEEHQKIMANDGRWWNVEAYSEKVAVNLNDFYLTEVQKDDVIKQALHYLLESY